MEEFVESKEEQLLRTLVRGKKAMLGKKSKFLARRCRVSQPKFSNILSGEIAMPESVKEILIRELSLESIWNHLSAPTEVIL